MFLLFCVMTRCSRCRILLKKFGNLDSARPLSTRIMWEVAINQARLINGRAIDPRDLILKNFWDCIRTVH